MLYHTAHRFVCGTQKDRLMLLGSPPDMVHGFLSHRTHMPHDKAQIRAVICFSEKIGIRYFILLRELLRWVLRSKLPLPGIYRKAHHHSSNRSNNLLRSSSLFSW